jgi:putative effector of murein hydrolase
MTLDTHPILQAIEADPLFGLGITLVTYRSAVSVQRRCGGLVLLNPVLVSVAVIVLILKFGGISYADYMRGGQYISLLLGPATVALALPLYDNLASIRRSARAILPSVVLGSVISSIGAMFIGRLLGATIWCASIARAPRSSAVNGNFLRRSQLIERKLVDRTCGPSRRFAAVR